MIFRVETLSIIVFNASICMAVVLFRLWDGDTNLLSVLLIQSLAVFSLLIMHSYAWMRQGGSDLSLAYLFFMMVFIFNLGKTILFIFFFDQRDEFFNFFSEHDYQLVSRAFEYSYVGLVVISSAMLLSHTDSKPKIEVPTDVQLVSAKVVGLLFLLVSLPSAVIDLKDMLVQVVSGGYFALYSSDQSYGAAGIVKVLSFFMFPALYLLIVGFKDVRWVGLSILIFALLYSGVKMAMGARLVALVPFLILLSLWDITIKPVNRKVIYVIAGTMVLVVFPALSLLRVGQELGHAESSAIFAIIKEMSDSISPLVWVMQRVPWEFDFEYGHSFYLAMTTAVPNLFWDVHPAKSGSLALWLVNEVNPWIAKRGGGYGFSIFAEFYINFYWFGMIPLFITSILITKLAKIKANPINTAFCFACFLGLMLWPRGEAVAVGRFILWNVGIPWLIYRFLIFSLIRFK